MRITTLLRDNGKRFSEIVRSAIRREALILLAKLENEGIDVEKLLRDNNIKTRDLTG